MTASEFIIEGEKRYWLHPAAAGHSAATLTPEVWMSSARNSRKLPSSVTAGRLPVAWDNAERQIPTQFRTETDCSRRRVSRSRTSSNDRCARELMLGSSDRSQQCKLRLSC